MGKSVLIIDDEISVCNLLKINLRLKGFFTETALSGCEGIQKAEKKRFNLIILDVALPAMDGIETCRILKSMDEYADTPVIMISSRSDSVTISGAMQAGAADYITKPFTFEDIFHCIDNHLPGLR